MTDQLTLELEAVLPNLPSALRPMLPRPLAAPFDSPDHLFEPAWGGLRALAFIGPASSAGTGDVRFVGEDGAPIEPVPPELQGLAARVAARSAILDGELVAVDPGGHADPDALRRRLDPASHGRRRPVAYLVFDLLHLDGRPLIGLPLDRRREALRRVLRPGDEVIAVPAIPGEGRALHAAVTAQGLAGTMARLRRGPYLPGTRSRLWRFVAAAPGAGTTSGHPGYSAPGPGEDDLPVTASAPVLALIRRLPLGLDDPEPSGGRRQGA
jgi:bifunctional non-homologous end joining protein LigD